MTHIHVSVSAADGPSFYTDRIKITSGKHEYWIAGSADGIQVASSSGPNPYLVVMPKLSNVVIIVNGGPSDAEVFGEQPPARA